MTVDFPDHLPKLNLSKQIKAPNQNYKADLSPYKKQSRNAGSSKDSKSKSKSKSKEKYKVKVIKSKEHSKEL